MKKLKSLSVFFPAYNDAITIPYLLASVYPVASRIAKSFDVTIINDGSSDNIKEVVSELQNYYPHLRIISHISNRGYGAALIDGFKHAKNQWIFYTDGDGQYDPSELSCLFSRLNPLVDIVNGFKLVRQDTWIRKIAGALYNLMLHQLYTLPIADIDCDFRLIRRKALKNVRLSFSSGVICLQLVTGLQRAGARFIEVGIHHYPRPVGSSQFFRHKHLIQTLVELVQFFLKYS